MPTVTNQLRQVYKIRGGVIDIKIVTEDALSAREMEDFGNVIAAVESYAEQWPVEDPELRAAEELAGREGAA